MVLLSSATLLLIYCVIFLSIIERRTWQCLTLIVDVSGSPFIAINVPFTYFIVLLFGENTFKTAMSSWCIEPFIIIKRTPPKTPGEFLAWKCTLSDIYIATLLSFDSRFHDRIFSSSYFQPAYIIVFEGRLSTLAHSITVFHLLCQSVFKCCMCTCTVWWY